MEFLLNALGWLIWLINVYLIAAGLFFVSCTIVYINQQLTEHKQNKVLNVSFGNKYKNQK